MSSYLRHSNLNILQVNLDRERGERGTLEAQLRAKAQELMNLQARHESTLTEYNAK